jgi:hypothetical protein
MAASLAAKALMAEGVDVIDLSLATFRRKIRVLS